MPSTYSPSLRIELIGAGEQSGTWNVTTNNNLGALLEQSIAGNTSVNVTAGNVTLTSLNGVVDEARSSVLSVTGTPGATRVITIPNVNKNYTVQNSTANIVQIKTSAGTAFDCPPLSHSYVSCNTSNVVVGRSITTGANAITSLAAPFASPAFTGVPTAPTAAVGTNTTQLATTAFVQAAIPTGSIILWSGSIVSIPAGWALCNGASGTPDLRDRFVVGAGTTYAVNATGGANTVTLDGTQIPSHTHTGSGTTASTNLAHTHSGTTVSADISHTHAVSGNTGNQSVDHTHTGTTNGGGAHNHLLQYRDGGTGPFADAVPGSGGALGGQLSGIIAVGDHTHTFTTGSNSVSHQHAISLTSGAMSANSTHTHTFTTGAMSANADHTHTFSFTSAATGGGLSHENRPPYFALAYIMKT
jgi:microcystin-dependent protein